MNCISDQLLVSAHSALSISVIGISAKFFISAPLVKSTVCYFSDDTFFNDEKTYIVHVHVPPIRLNLQAFNKNVPHISFTIKTLIPHFVSQYKGSSENSDTVCEICFEQMMVVMTHDLHCMRFAEGH